MVTRSRPLGGTATPWAQMEPMVPVAFFARACEAGRWMVTRPPPAAATDSASKAVDCGRDLPLATVGFLVADFLTALAFLAIAGTTFRVRGGWRCDTWWN